MPPPDDQPEKPEERLPTSWIYALSKNTLEGNLQAMGLDNQGTVDELRKRFRDSMKRNRSPAPVPIQTSSNVNPVPIPQTNVSTIEKVRKWGLNYDDSSDPVAFLERLQELQECYNINDNDMLTALPQVFKNNALLWFRNNKNNWNTWQDFINDFKVQYMHPRYDKQIEDEIRARHQRPKENFKDYLTAMSTLMRRGKPVSAVDKYDRIYDNMQPSYKLYIQRDSNTSITDLARKAAEYELIVDEQKKFSSHSSSDNKLSLKSNPNNSSKHVNAAQTKPIRHSKSNQYNAPSTSKQKPAVTTASICGYFSEPNKRCWKCAQPGHVRTGCRNATKLFCGRCGKLGVLGRDCRCQRKRPSEQYVNKQSEFKQNKFKPNKSFHITSDFKTKHVTSTSELNQKPINKDARIWVSTRICETVYHALVDTGATNSCIDSETASILTSKGVSCLSEYTSKICLADGRIIKSLGKMNVPVCMNNQTLNFDFLIMPNASYKVILGIDALEAFNAMIDVKNKQVLFEHNQDKNNSEASFATLQNMSEEVNSNDFVTKAKRQVTESVMQSEPGTAPVKPRCCPYWRTKTEAKSPGRVETVKKMPLSRASQSMYRPGPPQKPREGSVRLRPGNIKNKYFSNIFPAPQNRPLVNRHVPTTHSEPYSPETVSGGQRFPKRMVTRETSWRKRLKNNKSVNF